MHASSVYTQLSLDQCPIASSFQRARKASHLPSIRHGHANTHPPQPHVPMAIPKLRSTTPSLPSIHGLPSPTAPIRRRLRLRPVHASHPLPHPTHEPPTNQPLPERRLLLPTQRRPTLRIPYAESTAQHARLPQHQPVLETLHHHRDPRTMLHHRPVHLPPAPRNRSAVRSAPPLPPRRARCPGSRARRTWFHWPWVWCWWWCSHVEAGCGRS
jgi:hypothetical protein